MGVLLGDQIATIPSDGKNSGGYPAYGASIFQIIIH